MKSTLQWITRFPEIYFILVILLVGYSPTEGLNGFSLLIGVVLLLQTVFGFKPTGLFFSIIFSFITFYFILATASELTEFSGISESAYGLLIGGFLLSLVNVVFCTLMWRKYFGRSLKGAVE